MLWFLILIYIHHGKKKQFKMPVKKLVKWKKYKMKKSPGKVSPSSKMKAVAAACTVC